MIKRYNLYATDVTGVRESLYGQWVEYEEHRWEVDQLRHKIMELELALEDYGDDGEE
jgi:hypothetical protein